MEKFCNEAYHVFFNTLADRKNLEIIDGLVDAPKNASEIAASLGLKTRAVSRNLEQLQHCALVHAETVSDRRLYSVNLEILVPLGELLAFHMAKHCPDMRECIAEGKLKEHMKREAAKDTYIEH